MRAGASAATARARRRQRGGSQRGAVSGWAGAGQRLIHFKQPHATPSATRGCWPAAPVVSPAPCWPSSLPPRGPRPLTGGPQRLRRVCTRKGPAHIGSSIPHVRPHAAGRGSAAAGHGCGLCAACAARAACTTGMGQVRAAAIPPFLPPATKHTHAPAPHHAPAPACLQPAVPSPHIILQRPHHQRRHRRQPLGQQQAAPRQLSQAQAPAVPGGVAGTCGGGGYHPTGRPHSPAVLPP